MNRSQARVVAATFSHVSELLDGILRLVRDDVSPFSRERADISPYESRMLMSFATELRAAMAESLAHLGIPLPTATISARWGATTSLLFAEVALSELTPERLRGYGDLDADAVESIRAVVAELEARVARATALMRGGGEAQLERAVGAVGGATGRLLTEIFSLARRRQIVELYPEIAAVAERATAAVADVGVFGRISAGKSSLINAIVGTEVLPVGATPVTALPLRVERGEARLVVRHADGRTQVTGTEAVAGYATQSESAGRPRDIVALELYVPSAPAAIRFLDTPGVGSYATPTAAAAFAWLPRCDLGLVLIPAGTAVDREDLALLSGLRAAGVEYRILLSKSDLLAGNELEAATRYIAEEVQRSVGGTQPRVLHVSTAPGSALQRLQDEVLDSLVAEREARSTVRLHRRLEHLVARTEAALVGGESNSMGDALSRRAVLSRVAERAHGGAAHLTESTDAVLDRAAAETMAAWRAGDTADEALRKVLVDAAAEALADVRHELTQLVVKLPGAEPPADYAMPPVFVLEPLAPLPDMAPPSSAAALFARRRAEKRLEPLRDRLAVAYRAYATELRRWVDVVVEGVAETAAATEAPEAPATATLSTLRALLDEIEA